MVAPARATVTIFLVVKGRGVEGQKTSFLVGSVGGGKRWNNINQGLDRISFRSFSRKRSGLREKKGGTMTG